MLALQQAESVVEFECHFRLLSSLFVRRSKNEASKTWSLTKSTLLKMLSEFRRISFRTLIYGKEQSFNYMILDEMKLI